MTRFKRELLTREIKAGSISMGRLYQLTGLKLEPKKVELNTRNKVSIILYLISCLSVSPWLVLSEFWSAPTWAEILAVVGMILLIAISILLDQKNLESWAEYISEKSDVDEYYSKYEQY